MEYAGAANHNRTAIHSAETVEYSYGSPCCFGEVDQATSTMDLGEQFLSLGHMVDGETVCAWQRVDCEQLEQRGHDGRSRQYCGENVMCLALGRDQRPRQMEEQLLGPNFRRSGMGSNASVRLYGIP